MIWELVTRPLFLFPCAIKTNMASTSIESDNLDSEERNQAVQVAVAPQRASISRERSMKMIEGKYGQRGKSDVNKISLHDRLQMFIGEHLCIRGGGKLFCNACHEIVSSKMSIIESHCKSVKHTQGKEKLLKSKKKEITIIEALKNQDEGISRLKTRTLPLEERAFRVEVVENYLKAGVPLYKVDKLRNLLEKGEHRLTDSSHLRQHIPLILKQEAERLKKKNLCARPTVFNLLEISP